MYGMKAAARKMRTLVEKRMRVPAGRAWYAAGWNEFEVREAGAYDVHDTHTGGDPFRHRTPAYPQASVLLVRRESTMLECEDPLRMQQPQGQIWVAKVRDAAAAMKEITLVGHSAVYFAVYGCGS